MKDLIQIAGVIDSEEALMLIEEGVDYVGFPLRLPVHKEDLSEDEAVDVIKLINPPHYGVLITYLNKAEEIVEFCNKLNVKIVQLHGGISKDELEKTKLLNPDLEVIKSLVINGSNYPELEKTISLLSPWVDAYITDTFDPVTGASGATGKTHDWRISKKLIQFSPKPVIIAGGLNPGNVLSAILELRPAGVDVHTGVEDPDGRKSRTMVREFVRESLKGFSLLNS